MKVIKDQIFLLLLILLSSCSNKRSSKPIDNIQEPAASLPRKEFEFTKATLYTIDSEIYNEPDTIVDFKDGSHAYENFFRGGSFIDSTGKPIHKRFTRFNLTKDQINILKDSFIYKFCNIDIHACKPIYRDVFVFYDSLNKVIAQAPICFGCSQVLIHPRMDEICEPNSTLDFKKLKYFIFHIKSE